jgi:glycosyltransferase involved in cell wall biosynthesis
VASRTGGLPEVVRDGVTGLLVPTGDVGAFSAALLALAADPARRARLGAAGRADAVSRFALEPAVDAWERLYRRVLAAGPSRAAA